MRKLSLPFNKTARLPDCNNDFPEYECKLQVSAKGVEKAFCSV
jgi:hypothetical protein